MDGNLGKHFNRGNLMWRGLMLVDWSCMRKCSGEIVDHLLLPCVVSQELRSFIPVFNVWGSVGDA